MLKSLMYRTGILTVAVLLFAHAAPAAPRFELVPLPPPENLGKMPVVPWVKPGDTDWQKTAPIFAIADAESGVKATGWVAVTNTDILAHIVVTDKNHTNNYTTGAIWQGDAIQLAVDARGDGVGSLPRDYVMVGPADASLGYALTDAGPAAWAYYHGRPGGKGAAPQLTPKITRDETTKLTTYDITLPWAEFQSAPGVPTHFGLTIMINDSEAGKLGQTRLYWGGGADGSMRPGLLNQLAVGPPPGEVIAMLPTRDSLWRASDYGEVQFAFATDQNLEVKAKALGASARFPIPAASAQAEIRRYALKVYPEDAGKNLISLDVQVVGPKGKMQTGGRVVLQTPTRTLDDLSSRVDTLLSHSPNVLFTRMLRTTEAVVRSEYQRATTQIDLQQISAANAISYAAKFLADLNGPAADWDQYAAHRRPLTLSFIARDGTLQPYQIILPVNWKPGETYPMIVYLHGAGTSDTLAFLHPILNPVTNPDGAEDGPEKHAFMLMPWARGSMNYHGIAETDVWEAIADATTTFKIDPDRTYLTGHSMGGNGTWGLGLRTPDKWAAIAIASANSWSCPLGLGIGGNAAGLPVWIWQGDNDVDTPVSQAYAMQTELRDNGVEPEMVIVAGGGHNMEPSARSASYAWLLKHVRKRPDKFSFVADTREHQMSHGIWLDRDESISFAPKFTCAIQGNTVDLTSTGTNDVWVSLGDDGLGLKGTVTVVWNGKQIYVGDAKTIGLDVKKGLIADK